MKLLGQQEIAVDASEIGCRLPIGGGNHLFWRAPDIALADMTAACMRLSEIDINRIGMEAKHDRRGGTYYHRNRLAGGHIVWEFLY